MEANNLIRILKTKRVIEGPTNWINNVALVIIVLTSFTIIMDITINMNSGYINCESISLQSFKQDIISQLYYLIDCITVLMLLAIVFHFWNGKKIWVAIPIAIRYGGKLLLNIWLLYIADIELSKLGIEVLLILILPVTFAAIVILTFTNIIKSKVLLILSAFTITVAVFIGIVNGVGPYVYVNNRNDSILLLGELVKFISWVIIYGVLGFGLIKDEKLNAKPEYSINNKYDEYIPYDFK